jgi:hypothetical protein
MKSLLLSLLLLSIPTVAIADNLPVNYMVLRGRVFNLDYLWGRGVAATASQTATPTATKPTEPPKATEYDRQIAFDNARRQILIEGIDNNIR